ncbi:DUF4158 domain-containing protein [Streptomyces sp. NBC_00161]|uniref:DUF4158 domain-containing protein n=1 Tax=Streptomyces sp. NBC_00161 TaxID=2975671 RepID=UPI003863B9B8
MGSPRRYAKRAPANRLGWAVQWGCVRMLGVFPTEDLSVVPAVVGGGSWPNSSTFRRRSSPCRGPAAELVPARVGDPAPRPRRSRRT